MGKREQRELVTVRSNYEKGRPTPSLARTSRAAPRMRPAWSTPTAPRHSKIGARPCEHRKVACASPDQHRAARSGWPRSRDAYALACGSKRGTWAV